LAAVSSLEWEWYYLDWVGIVTRSSGWCAVALAWGADATDSTRRGLRVAALSTLPGRAHDLVPRGARCVWSGVRVAVIGWIGYWFGPVGRQRAAVLALLLLVA